MKTPPRKLIEIVSKHANLTINGDKRGYIVENKNGSSVKINMGQLNTHLQWSDLAGKLSVLARES